MEEFLEVGGPRLPTLRGIKYTSKDLFEFGRCVVAQAEKYQIIYGSDQVTTGMFDCLNMAHTTNCSVAASDWCPSIGRSCCYWKVITAL